MSRLLQLAGRSRVTAQQHWRPGGAWGGGRHVCCLVTLLTTLSRAGKNKQAGPPKRRRLITTPGYAPATHSAGLGHRSTRCLSIIHEAPDCSPNTLSGAEAAAGGGERPVGLGSPSRLTMWTNAWKEATGHCRRPAQWSIPERVPGTPTRPGPLPTLAMAWSPRAARRAVTHCFLTHTPRSASHRRVQRGTSGQPPAAAHPLGP